MILTGSAIEKAVSHGDIVLSPFTPRHLNPNSYNFHLGSALKVPFGKILSTKRPNIWLSLRTYDGRDWFCLRGSSISLIHAKLSAAIAMS